MSAAPLPPASLVRPTRHAPAGERAPGLGEMLASSHHHGYLYAYPHKTAYRALAPPVPLAPLWDAEDRGRLSLYLHVPFCEMRCGFCNLFAQASDDSDAHNAYLGALQRQAAVVRGALGPARFARVAIGGGTPTLLSVAAFSSLLDLVERGFGASLSEVPASVETSPLTATDEHVALLASRGVARVSIGVQSFLEDETRAALRPQEPAVVARALDRLMASAIPVRNIDLIYGLPGQTPGRFVESVRRALAWRPEELYLYPLYVRPATGLGKKAPSYSDLRLAAYREARDLLCSEGYVQVSMRNFRRAGAIAGRRADLPLGPLPDHACQVDGMVGLGCGARSYTAGLHYAERWASGPGAVRSILADYVATDDAAFALARHGIALSIDERRRRHLIQSLLLAEGLDLAAYEACFGAPVLAHFPALRELMDHGLCALDAAVGRMALTPAGLAASDVVGPWLVSPRVRALSAEYEDL
jgi:oxygen-independent coproporphyrinogen-3 oxidase